MGESVITVALWVAEVVAEEIKYLCGVRKKVKRLSTELTGIANFLTDSTNGSRLRSETLKGIISDARNVAYDGEDAIETYVLVVQNELDEYEDGCLGFILPYVCLLPKALPTHGAGEQIDEINTRISALQSRITSFLANVPSPSAGDQALRRVYSFGEPEFGVVGFDHYSEELHNSLNDPNDKRVILICGMGGIGKSTLAKEIYQKPPPGRFKATGWAQATLQFDSDKVVQTLLYSLIPAYDTRRRDIVEQEIRAGSVRAFAALYEKMNTERCLVIIDDIKSPEDWRNIRYALPIQSKSGSRIILTSRNNNILESLDYNTQKFIQNVTRLDETNSWNLFQKITFPDSTSTDDDAEKKKVSKEMLKKCGGVPLAIVVLAKALKRKERVEEWCTHLNILTLTESGGAEDGVYGELYKVLRVSYDEMPSHLKHCFLHLANFPQGYEIKAQKLYQLWIGEGIIVKNNDSDFLEEDIAKQNLQELVSRSMVEVADRDGESIATCRLHDLMREVCIQLAKTENFIQRIDVDGVGLLRNDQYLSERDERLRRLAVYMHQEPTLQGQFSAAKKAPNLRALQVFPVGQQSDDEISCHQLMESVAKSYPLLRVFDCENVNGISGVVPDNVKKMIHLRYLGLANTRVYNLPSSIHKLRWLQTLDLQVDNDPPQVLSLPNVLWKMKRLRHLYLPHYGGSSLREIERLKSAPERYSIEGKEGTLRLDGLDHLQTLINLDLDRVNPNGLLDLESLRRLSAVCMTNIIPNALLHFVNHCPSLEAFMLKLHARVLERDPAILSLCKAIDQLEIYADPYSDFHFTQQLKCDTFHQNLSSLSIMYLQLDEDPFPVLEKLPNLDYLGLVMCYDKCEKLVCSAGGFPELTMIQLDALINLKDWEVAEGALPNLKTLLIINCRKLTLPVALEGVPDLTVFNEEEGTNVPEASASTSTSTC